MKRPVKSYSTLALAVAASLLSLSIHAAEPKPKAGSLQADFVMTRTLSALKTSLKSEGRLILGGHGRLRWETLSPSRSTLVIDGNGGWIRYPDLDVTKRFDASADPVMRVMSEHLLLLTSGKFDEAGRLYTVSPEKEGRRTLIPKQPEIKKYFKEMQVAVGKDNSISEVVLVSADGDKTAVSFHNVVKNPKLSADLFAEPKSR